MMRILKVGQDEKLHESDALYMNVLGMFDVMNMVGEVLYFEPQDPVDSRHGKIHTESTMLQLAQYYVNTYSLAIGRTEFTLNSLMGEFKAEELERVLCESTGQGRMDPEQLRWYGEGKSQYEPAASTITVMAQNLAQILPENSEIDI